MCFTARIVLLVGIASVAYAVQFPIYVETTNEDYTDIDLNTNKTEIVKFRDEYYVAGGIRVGNPPQKFNMTLNMDNYQSWLFSSSVKEQSCPGNPPGQRHFFNSRRSTTYRTKYADWDFLQLNYDQNMTCYNFTQARAGYDIGQDDFWDGASFTAQNVQFDLVTWMNGTLDRNWASDGMMGLLPNLTLGLDSINDPTTARDIAKAAGYEAISIYLSRFNKPTEATQPGKQAGYISFGQPDSTHCHNWTYFDDGREKDGPFTIADWTVNFKSYSVGNFTYQPSGGGNFVNLETGFPYLYIDLPVFEKTMSIIGATFDKTAKKYVVDCDSVTSMPDIVFNFNVTSTTNYAYNIPAVDYARNIFPRNDGKCAVLVYPMGYTFGSLAARSHCWLLDFKRGVSFAEAVHN